MRNDAFRAARWAMLLSLGLMVALAIFSPDAGREHTVASIGRHESAPVAGQADPLPFELTNRDDTQDGSANLTRAKTGKASPKVVLGFDGGENSDRSSDNLTEKFGGIPTRLTSSRRQRDPAADQTRQHRPTLFIEATRDRSHQRSPQVKLGPIVDSEPAADPEPAADSQPLAKLYIPDSEFGATTPEQDVGIRTADSARPGTAGVSSRVESQLASLQRRVDRLAQAQQAGQDSQLQRATQLLQQIQQTQQLQQLEKQLEKLESGAGKETAKSPTVDAPASPTADSTAPKDDPSTSADRKPSLDIQRADDGSERFSVQAQDQDMTRFLAMLGELAGMNILVGKGVSGTVTANLKDVTVEEALSAILRTHGYTFQREDRFIFVMTEADATARKQLTRKIVTKVYRPHYISVKDLEKLVTPILTPPPIGKIATTEASQTGIAPNDEEAGGDSLTQRDALLIQDYPEVIEEVDSVLVEMDVPPTQVVIEAMILAVTLEDSMEFGVNFALLNDGSNNLFVSGNGKTLNGSSGFPGVKDSIVPPAAEFIANTAGLKYGFIRGDMSLFIKALEGIADTNLIASPQLRVLNKQRAELIIGNKLSYKTLAFNDNQTVEDVKFLDVGTKLIIRPFASPDGLIRMEIHPERSSGKINTQTGLPDTSTTEVTTNVMVRDGTTVVIGGLIEEQVEESMERIPFLGALPWVGPVFRNKTERIQRKELIVLITPRIVHEPDDAEEGEAALYENRRRADHFRDNLSQVNRRNLARMHYELALDYFEECDYRRAERHIELALKYHKNDLDALRLRDQIEQACRDGRPGWLNPPFTKPETPQNELPQEVIEDDPTPDANLPPAPAAALE